MDEFCLSWIYILSAIAERRDTHHPWNSFSQSMWGDRRSLLGDMINIRGIIDKWLDSEVAIKKKQNRHESSINCKQNVVVWKWAALRSFKHSILHFKYATIRRVKFILRTVIYNSELWQMAMVLVVSHLGAPKVIALRHLLSVLLINIYFCEYSDTEVQFFFLQYEQSQGYVNKYSRKYILIWLAVRLTF